MEARLLMTDRATFMPRWAMMTLFIVMILATARDLALPVGVKKAIPILAIPIPVTGKEYMKARTRFMMEWEMFL